MYSFSALFIVPFVVIIPLCNADCGFGHLCLDNDTVTQVTWSHGLPDETESGAAIWSTSQALTLFVESPESTRLTTLQVLAQDGTPIEPVPADNTQTTYAASFHHGTVGITSLLVPNGPEVPIVVRPALVPIKPITFDYDELEEPLVQRNKQPKVAAGIALTYNLDAATVITDNEGSRYGVEYCVLVTEHLPLDNVVEKVTKTVVCMKVMFAAGCLPPGVVRPTVGLREIKVCRKEAFGLSVDATSAEVRSTFTRLEPLAADPMIGFYVADLTYGAEDKVVSNGALTTVGDNIEGKLTPTSYSPAVTFYEIVTDAVGEAPIPKLSVTATAGLCLATDPIDGTVDFCGSKGRRC